MHSGASRRPDAVTSLFWLTWPSRGSSARSQSEQLTHTRFCLSHTRIYKRMWSRRFCVCLSNRQRLQADLWPLSCGSTASQTICRHRTRPWVEPLVRYFGLMFVEVPECRRCRYECRRRHNGEGWRPAPPWNPISRTLSYHEQRIFLPTNSKCQLPLWLRCRAGGVALVAQRTSLPTDFTLSTIPVDKSSGRRLWMKFS